MLCPMDNRKVEEEMGQKSGEQEQSRMWGNQLRVSDLCPGTGDILKACDYMEK